MTKKALRRPAVRVAAGVALILALPLVAMQFTDEVVWSVRDFVLVGVRLAIIGAAIELAVKRRGSRGLAIGIGVLGVATVVVGRLDDAPGLSLIGVVLIASAIALGVRSRRADSRRGPLHHG
jgi:hypothetical protein